MRTILRNDAETNSRLLHKGESLCCFRDSASVTYGGMLPSDLTLSALRFILSAKSGQSCLQDCETVDFCISLELSLTQRYEKKKLELFALDAKKSDSHDRVSHSCSRSDDPSRDDWIRTSDLTPPRRAL